VRLRQAEHTAQKARREVEEKAQEEAPAAPRKGIRRRGRPIGEG